MARLLYRQKIPIAAQALALGTTYTFQIPRESLIEGLNIYVEGNVTTVATAVPIDGLSRLISSISIRGSMANAPAIEICNGCFGPDLFEMHQFHKGSLPSIHGGLGATGWFRLNLPVWFREWFFSSEVKNLLTAVPAYLMSDFVLTVTIDNQANLGAGLVIAAGGLVGVDVHQFYRDSVPMNLPFLRSTYESLADANIVTQTDREIKLPSGGLYSNLLLRSYSAANVKQLSTVAGGGPIVLNPNGTIRLYDISRFTKAETTFHSLREDNLEITLDALVNGNAAFVYNRGESSMFQTGQIGQALNNVTLVFPALTTANSSVRAVYRRIFDPANALGLNLA